MVECDAWRSGLYLTPFPLLTPYNRHMIKQHNGAFLVNETAANDPICQQVMASYINQLKAESIRRERIRQGLEPAPAGQWGNWSISDRH